MVIQIGNIKIKSDIEQAIIRSAGATSQRITIDRSKPVKVPYSRKPYTPKKTQEQDDKQGLNFIDTAMLLTPVGAGIQGVKGLINMMGGGAEGGNKSPDQIPELKLPETGVDLGLTGFGATGLILNAIRGLTNEGAMTPSQYGSTFASQLLGLPGVITAMLGNIKAEQGGIQGAVPPDSQIFITLPPNSSPGIPYFPDIGFPDLSGLGEWGTKIFWAVVILGLLYVGVKVVK